MRKRQGWKLGFGSRIMDSDRDRPPRLMCTALPAADSRGRANERLAPSAYRICSRCKQEMPATREHFSFITSRDKWHAWCKPCCAEDRRRDRKENPERYRALDARRDKDRVRELQRKRYDPTKAALNQRTAEQKARYNANRRNRLASDPQHAAKIRERQREWAERNGDQLRELRQGYWARATTHRRLRTYFTSAICHSLKGSTKGGRSWQDILGYTADDLRAHLERQFAKGMSWDNYGQWHVDHIVPVAEHRYTGVDDPEFMACWALTNLRPLWARDNSEGVAGANSRTQVQPVQD